MINNKKVVAVLPAYNAEKTLQRTVQEIPAAVDACILVDDHSTDDNRDSCPAAGSAGPCPRSQPRLWRQSEDLLRAALDAGADIVVMLHPDYQYSPLLVEPMASMIAFGVYDIVLGSRILGGGALRGGMPRHKYVANRLLTLDPESRPRRQAVGIPHRLPRLQPRDALVAAARRPIPTTSSSTISCSPSASTSAPALARFPAPHATSLRHLPSISAAAQFTVSAFLKPPPTAWPRVSVSTASRSLTFPPCS